MDLQEIAKLLKSKPIADAMSMKTIGNEMLIIDFEDGTNLQIYARLDKTTNDNGRIHYEPTIVGE